MTGPTQAAPATTVVPTRVRTLAALFAWRATETPAAPGYRQFEAATKTWADHSWRETRVRVDRFGDALAALALPRGARIAMLLPNGLDAVCIDQAALARACVPVPLHVIDNPASIAYILADSDASVLFAATDAQWAAIATVGTALPALRHVVVLRRDAAAAMPATGPRVLHLDEWLALPRPAPAADAGFDTPQPGYLAAIVYTSGTTGRPKGVMLTHANVLANVRATLKRVAARDDDVFLSFLPLSHTFERTAGYYVPIAAGCCVAFSRSVADLMQDLQTIRPTVLVSVPRIYERVYAGMQALVAGAALRAALLGFAQAVGWRRFERAQSRQPAHAVVALLDAAVWPLLDRWVAAPVRARFGGRLRIAVSGGAPISATVAHCFLGLGVPIVQGYGMTETAPVVAANAPDDNDPATVGRLLDGVEARIGVNQELQVRGPNVMAGYWKRDADTAAAMLDGWLRTGDQAAFEGGRLRILGRVKEIIVTSTGEKIAPTDLELAITGDPLFEQAWVVGEGRPFIACVVVVNRAQWEVLARELGLPPDAPQSLADPRAHAAAMARIERRTHEFPRHGQPRKVLLTTEPWTVENTLMTPTLKLKRLNLQARFAAAVDALYGG